MPTGSVVLQYFGNNLYNRLKEVADDENTTAGHNQQMVISS